MLHWCLGRRVHVLQNGRGCQELINDAKIVKTGATATCFEEYWVRDSTPAESPEGAINFEDASGVGKGKGWRDGHVVLR